MASLFELVNRLSVLVAGRRPQWVAQVDAGGYPNGAPAPAANIGVFLENALKALVSISPREETYRRTGRLALTFHAASTYTVNIDGNAVATLANTDAATTLQDIADNINADSPGAGDVVLATAIDTDDDAVIDTLLLQGIAEDDYTVNLSVAGGTGTIAGVLDRSGVSARLWFTGRDPNARGDYQQANAASYVIDRRGFLERFDVGGLDRVYVEVFSLLAPADVAGAAATIIYRAPGILIGPGVEETTTT